MKKRFTLKVFINSLFLLVLFSCNTAVRKEKMNVVLPIIPQPKEVHVYEGSFVLDSMTHLVFSTEEQKKVVSWFNKELQKLV